MRRKLLLATSNNGKIKEYRALLDDLPYDLVTLAEEGISTLVDETGETLQENARLKATVLARESGLLALADDSGLEVDALNGEPGVKSARYAGADASDRERVNYLLARLEGIPLEKRSARFRCVIALAAPDGEALFYSGECRGIIALEPRGEGGFGYDPIFYLPELDKTMAELPPETKNRISHRAQAAQKIYQILKADPFSA